MPIDRVIKTLHDTARPVKIWTSDIEDEALTQAKNIARLPFIHHNGVALMPDVHAGNGATVGSVIATTKAIIPAAVGVDIGCGMVAVRTTLTANDLPDSLSALRSGIEVRVPLGPGGAHDISHIPAVSYKLWSGLHNIIDKIAPNDRTRLFDKAWFQLSSLGSGNHFIEVCLDEEQRVWVMLHSGSRGIGNMIGTHFIELAKREMERWMIHLPDTDLAYLPEGSQHFDDYIAAVSWAQDYAKENRRLMLLAVLEAMRECIPVPFELTDEAINCHHNYIERENHFGENLWITRKGAIRAREGDLGIIPGSMGAKSYIVRGKGEKQSYCSCSHGAGRKMSRAEAKRRFTVEDLAAQTAGIECHKGAEVLDEIPSSYKDIDTVMANQTDLVEVVHTLRQVLCVKGK